MTFNVLQLTIVVSLKYDFISEKKDCEIPQWQIIFRPNDFWIATTKNQQNVNLLYTNTKMLRHTGT